jgi:hypothetical protein
MVTEEWTRMLLQHASAKKGAENFSTNVQYPVRKMPYEEASLLCLAALRITP